MHPSLRLANVHKPLIRFLGKRKWPAKAEEQYPHPFAPPELKQHFAEFVKKFERTPSAAGVSAVSDAARKSGGGGAVYEDFWQAPSRFWKRELDDWEVDLVQSGGASLH